MNGWRTALAGATASFVGVGVVGLWFAMLPVTQPAGSAPITVGEWFDGTVFGGTLLFAFGVPLAVLVELVVGVPAFFALRAQGWLNVWGVSATAGVAGALALPVFNRWFWGVGTWWDAVPLGLVAGLAAGACFYWVAFRKTDQLAGQTDCG